MNHLGQLHTQSSRPVRRTILWRSWLDTPRHPAHPGAKISWLPQDPIIPLWASYHPVSCSSHAPGQALETPRRSNRRTVIIQDLHLEAHRDCNQLAAWPAPRALELDLRRMSLAMPADTHFTPRGMPTYLIVTITYFANIRCSELEKFRPKKACQ